MAVVVCACAGPTSAMPTTAPRSGEQRDGDRRVGRRHRAWDGGDPPGSGHASGLAGGWATRPRGPLGPPTLGPVSLHGPHVGGVDG